MELSYEWAGEAFGFECFDNMLSGWTCAAILRGETYPLFPFVDDVQVVLDIGANCGAATVLFSKAYPGAEIHAFEPASAPYRFLERNTAGLDHVHAHHVGLDAEDGDATLYLGALEPGTSSIHPNWETSDRTETITLRSTAGWIAEHGIDRIDVVKIDTEGCELPILAGLAPLLAAAKVIYLEFHREDDRKEMDRLLGGTHALAVGRAMFDTGEVAYVERGLVPAPGSPEMTALLGRLLQPAGAPAGPPA